MLSVLGSHTTMGIRYSVQFAIKVREGVAADPSRSSDLLLARPVLLRSIPLAALSSLCTISHAGIKPSRERPSVPPATPPFILTALPPCLLPSWWCALMENQITGAGEAIRRLPWLRLLQSQEGQERAVSRVVKSGVERGGEVGLLGRGRRSSQAGLTQQQSTLFTTRSALLDDLSHLIISSETTLR